MYEHLLGIRQPPSGSYGFERVSIAPPLIDSLPAMAGKIGTVRGEIALSWAWANLTTPMQGGFALNCTIPPNVLATVVMPVPGLTTPTISEGGVAVWKGGHCLSGVVGVTGGHAETNDTTVMFTVGSGSYHFASSSSSSNNSNSNSNNTDSAIISGCDQRLECPSGRSIARVLRAGLMQTKDIDQLIYDRIVETTPLQRRYLVAHALEGLCHGSMSCEVTLVAIQQAISPAVTFDDNELGMPACAIVACL
jgi:hypothetical protein